MALKTTLVRGVEPRSPISCLDSPCCSLRCAAAAANGALAAQGLRRRKLPQVVATIAGITPSQSLGPVKVSSLERTSLDPSRPLQFSLDTYVPGFPMSVHSQEDIDIVLEKFKDKLVVIECKSSHCRPCKAFVRKYTRLAEQFPDCVFLELVGDESRDTLKLMVQWQIKSTPTFRIYWEGKHMLSYIGTSEDKLAHTVYTITDPEGALAPEESWLDFKPTVHKPTIKRQVLPYETFDDANIALSSTEDELID